MIKWIENLREKYREIVSMYKQKALDDKNKKDYLSIIREGTSDRNSKFSKFNLKLGDDGESIIYITRIPIEVQTSNSDYLIGDKLNESTFLITNFLQREVGFGFYVSSVPDFYHVEDSSSNDVSITYIAVWKFVPVIDDSLRFKLNWYPWFIGLGVLSIIGAIVGGCLLL